MKPSENHFPEARILVIDDNAENVRLVVRLLEWAGYLNVQTQTNSALALELLESVAPDIILLDLHMPKPDGYEILAYARGESSPLRLVPVLVFTADQTGEAKARALEAGASDFLTKPGEAQEILLRVRNFLETRKLWVNIGRHASELECKVKARTAELSQARREALETLARAAEFRDDETGHHTQRVGELSELIARQLGEQDDYVEALRLAAPLHDIGKVGLPDSILLKPGGFSDAERQIMRTHPLIGAQIFGMSESPMMVLARDIALCHHEWWDGSGYPCGLVGEAIPLAARIVAVADVYDALTHRRPYKPAWTQAEALTEIQSLSGRQFCPGIVRAFLSLMRVDQLSRAA